MKKRIALLLACALLLTGTACSGKDQADMEPEISQMKTICELSVMECYYHNVAKLTEKDAAGFLIWKKDKHFWIEYSSIVKLGVDASLVSMAISGNEVTITLPAVQVLSCNVIAESLNADSYITDKNSAKIRAEDEVIAFEKAQSSLKETVMSDKALLAEARDRVQKMLEDYITNIGTAVGKEYTIRWVYLDAVSETPAPTETPEPAA